MAIKITKAGQKEFHGFCKWCGCEFTYEISDLKLSATEDKLDCPTCGKTYHHNMMVQDPTIPGGIGRLQTWPPDPIPCMPDMTKTDPCTGCAWRENLLRDGIYIGDTPCTWCNKNKFSCNSSDGVTSSAISYPEAHLNSCTISASECGVGSTTTIHSASGLEADREYVNQKLQEVYDASGVKSDDLTQGTVMNTILNACYDYVNSVDKCGDTEGRNSCSSGHKCRGNKNCNGKH